MVCISNGLSIFIRLINIYYVVRITLGSGDIEMNKVLIFK